MKQNKKNEVRDIKTGYKGKLIAGEFFQSFKIL